MYLRLCTNCHYELAPTTVRDTSNPMGDCNTCTVRNSFYTYVHITDITI